MAPPDENISRLEKKVDIFSLHFKKTDNVDFFDKRRAAAC